MSRLLVSADSHIMEPLDLWTRHLPAHLRDRGPRIEKRDGRECLMTENNVIRTFDSLSAREPQSGGESKTFGMGASDPDARLRDLDLDGVWGEVIYPNLAFFCCGRIEDPELQLETAKVYNDWIADRFIGASERFAPVALLPTFDVDAAVGELRRVARKDFRAVMLPAHSDQRPYNDPVYEPLWAAAEELRIPLTFHAGTGRTQTPAHGAGGAVVNYVVVVGGPMETVAYLCGAGILARHPELRVVMVECGSGWLAWVLHAMDDAYREHAMWVRPKLEMLPSEYFRRQGAVTFQHDPVGIANLQFTGERCLMWGSDYPHPEGTWPKSREYLARQLKGVPEATIDKIVRDNAATLYRMKVPAAA